MRTLRMLFLTATCLLAGSGFLFADSTGTIAGTVVDRETKEPLPGAVVILLGTDLGANTDLDGRFMIHNVPGGDLLRTGEDDGILYPDDNQCQG